MPDESPYQWVQRRLSEGASADSLAEHLATRGLDPVEIDRLLDRDVRPTSERSDPPEIGSTASPQLLLGLLLTIAGLAVFFGGLISWFPVAVVIAGITRIITAWNVDLPSRTKQEEARRAMVELTDPSQQCCAVHPNHAAMGTCPRCGAFCCALCTPSRGFIGGRICMSCQALPEVQAARRQRASRGAALTLSSAPATLVLLLAIERVVAAPSASPMQMLVVLLVACAPWLVLALLQRNARSGWPSLVSVVPWLGVEALLLISGARLPALLWLLPLCVTFYGWANTRHAARGEPAYLTTRDLHG